MKANQTINQNSISAYIHIPFCEHICYYCDFNKVFLKGQPVDEYLQALLKEIELTLEQQPVAETKTLYIGGGTPTALSAQQLDVLLAGVTKRLPYQSGEFTVEANPGDLTTDKLAVLKNYGVNRLSMGVQTFDDRLLKKIGRKHTAKEVYETLDLVAQHGFSNVSIDLIYALPGQSLASFRDSLEQALALDLPHYALYSLILENKTLFMNWVRKGRFELPEQEVEAQMFQETMDAMKQHGYEHYEISNFAKAGFESQHNQVYWNNLPYYGFGAGASGYLGNVRYKNHGPIQHYLQPLKTGELPIIEREILTVENQMEEELFLGLRKQAGVSYATFAQRFGKSLMSVYGAVIDELVTASLLTKTETSIQLTDAGVFRGNDVFERFLFDHKQN